MEKREAGAYMFVPRPIGFVSSPYNDTSEIPKVCTPGMKPKGYSGLARIRARAHRH